MTEPYCSFTGEAAAKPGEPHSEHTLAQHSKMEVSLTLTSKFDIFKGSDERPDARGMLLRYASRTYSLTV